MGNRQSGNQRHRKAWAPYNFVPMPDELIHADLDSDGNLPRHDAYDLERHTGYYDIKLVTETPLFVRGMLSISEQESGIESRLNPNAFSIDGRKPVIPGSSLRGMLRTLTEIVTSSKMHFVVNNKLVYRAVFGRDSLAQQYRNMVTDQLGHNHFMYPSSRMRGGYLKRGNSASGWVIRPAQLFSNESFVLVSLNAINRLGLSPSPQSLHSVYVNPPAGRTTYYSRTRQGLALEVAEATTVSLTGGGSLQRANLVVSGNAPRRHWYAAIFDPVAGSSGDLQISRNMWEDYCLDRDLQRGIPSRPLREDDPLFYLVDHSGDLVFFGPTLFFRVPYAKSIHGQIAPALRQSNPRIDYAEAMFGFVSEQGENRSPTAYAGRVSVTSAQVTEECDNYFDETIVPRILASPKPTTFQHYLEQPQGWRTPTDQLLHYGDNTRIRGYKLYWRQMIRNLREAAESDSTITPHNSTQHTVITPVSSTVKFKFRVYFENLSDVELGALHWVLTFGGDQDARHQLGMGKPFGLGVVKLEPTLVLTKRQLRYNKLFAEDGSWFRNEVEADADFINEVVSSFKSKVGNFDSQKRIRELLTLVRKQEVRRFAYMQIEPRNDYAQRPVLPDPSEVD